MKTTEKYDRRWSAAAAQKNKNMKKHGGLEAKPQKWQELDSEPTQHVKKLLKACSVRNKLT